MLNLFPGEYGTRDTFRYVEEKLTIGVWTWDLDTGAMQWSPGMYRLLGLPDTVPAHLDTVNDMVHRDDRRPRAEIERVVSGATPIDREFRIVWRNGRVRWVHNIGELVIDTNSGARRAVGVMRDVSFRKETMQKLEVSQGRLHALTVAVGAPVWDAKINGSIPRVENWKEVQHDPNEVPGDSWFDLVHPDDRPNTLAAWNAARERRETYEVEHRLRRSDGSYRWSLSRAVPVQILDIDVTEYVGVTFDVEASRTLPLMTNAEHKLTGAQIRAARGILRWSVKDLADNAGVSKSAIRRLEETDGASGDETIAPIARALTKAGIAFFAALHGKPAVGLR
jgi:PAS domain S-box-containing protein